MSLWYKNPSEITFADIDGFCMTKQPEGPRLEYKVEFPSDLAKTIAAFANTLGGLILLGVDADKTENKPIWPPSEGMATEAGLTERALAIAQTAIYPPVRISVSNPIENTHLPGKVLLVIRVDESREAPHATDKNSKVYVYERKENANVPYELANLARIEQLIARRRRLIDEREAELEANIARAERLMQDNIPIRWISIAPVFPWREIHDPYACAAFHTRWVLPRWQNADWRYQTVKGGSFAVASVVERGKTPVCRSVSSVSSNGTLFYLTYAEEAYFNSLNTAILYPNANKGGPLSTDLQRFREVVSGFLIGAQKFYNDSESRPGEVVISMGMNRVLGVVMNDTHKGSRSNAPCPDPTFRIDRTVEAENILADRMTVVNGMLDDIAFAFNANAIPINS